MGQGASRRAFLTGRIAREALRTEPPLPRAPLPTRHGNLEQLLALAAGTPLADRALEIEQLTRTSVRLEAVDSDERRGWSQIGGRPAVDDADWPRSAGRRLRFLAQFALTELPALPTGWPARDDLLLLFYDDATRSVVARRLPRPRTRWRRASPRRTGTAMASAAETTLPRAWAAPVRALGLQTAERDAWQALRADWAVAQGAELEDEARGTRVVHRLGGWPDERSGFMPALAELRAADIDDADGDPDAAIADAGLGDRLPRWRLLAQFSADRLLDWNWGDDRARLYVWVDADDLASGDLSTVTAFAR